MNTYCPACMHHHKVSKVKIVGLTNKMYKCRGCKKKYPLNATLVSENTIRWYIREQDGELDHLLEKL